MGVRCSLRTNHSSLSVFTTRSLHDSSLRTQKKRSEISTYPLIEGINHLLFNWIPTKRHGTVRSPLRSSIEDVWSSIASPLKTSDVESPPPPPPPLLEHWSCHLVAKFGNAADVIDDYVLFKAAHCSQILSVMYGARCIFTHGDPKPTQDIVLNPESITFPNDDPLVFLSDASLWTNILDSPEIRRSLCERASEQAHRDLSGFFHELRTKDVPGFNVVPSYELTSFVQRFLRGLAVSTMRNVQMHMWNAFQLPMYGLKKTMTPNRTHEKMNPLSRVVPTAGAKGPRDVPFWEQTLVENQGKFSRLHPSVKLPVVAPSPSSSLFMRIVSDGSQTSTSEDQCSPAAPESMDP